MELTRSFLRDDQLIGEVPELQRSVSISVNSEHIEKLEQQTYCTFTKYRGCGVFDLIISFSRQTGAYSALLGIQSTLEIESELPIERGLCGRLPAVRLSSSRGSALQRNRQKWRCMIVLLFFFWCFLSNICLFREWFASMRRYWRCL